MELMKTSLPEMYTKGLYDEFNTMLSNNHVPYLVDIFFNGITTVLGYAKKKDKPVSYLMERIDGTFILGACIQFVESKDKKTPGSWNIFWTFDLNDIPEDAIKFKITDSQTHTYFRSYAIDKYGIKMGTDDNFITIMRYLSICIRKWLDENAKEDNEVSVEMDGVFKARVAIENKEKVFALECMGETTAKAKEDSAIEK
jgi:hypothetical protein